MLNKDELDAITTLAKEVVKPAYTDAVQPVAQEVGKALKTVGGVINVALAPLAIMVYGYETIKNRLNDRLEVRLSKVAPENIVSPDPQIVGPLLDKYKYVHDKEGLSDMFVNLLANAMDKDQVKKAHPSFVNVISELSPDEARLLKKIATSEVLPKLDVRVREKTPGNPGYQYVLTNFTDLGSIASLNYPDLASTYISNLERLNIVSCTIGDFQESYTNKEHYKPLQDSPIIRDLRESVKDKYDVEIKEGIIKITEFGKLFLNAVL